MPRRLEAGPLLVTLGALLLLVSLFLDWFSGEVTAWEAFEAWDLVLFVLALGSIAAALGLTTQDVDLVDRRFLPPARIPTPAPGSRSARRSSCSPARCSRSGASISRSRSRGAIRGAASRPSTRAGRPIRPRTATRRWRRPSARPASGRGGGIRAPRSASRSSRGARQGIDPRRRTRIDAGARGRLRAPMLR